MGRAAAAAQLGAPQSRLLCSRTTRQGFVNHRLRSAEPAPWKTGQFPFCRPQVCTPAKSRWAYAIASATLEPPIRYNLHPEMQLQPPYLSRLSEASRQGDRKLSQREPMPMGQQMSRIPRAHGMPPGFTALPRQRRPSPAGVTAPSAGTCGRLNNARSAPACALPNQPCHACDCLPAGRQPRLHDPLHLRPTVPCARGHARRQLVEQRQRARCGDLALRQARPRALPPARPSRPSRRRASCPTRLVTCAPGPGRAGQACAAPALNGLAMGWARHTPTAGHISHPQLPNAAQGLRARGGAGANQVRYQAVHQARGASMAPGVLRSACPLLRGCSLSLEHVLALLLPRRRLNTAAASLPRWRELAGPLPKEMQPPA